MNQKNLSYHLFVINLKFLMHQNYPQYLMNLMFQMNLMNLKFEKHLKFQQHLKYPLYLKNHLNQRLNLMLIDQLYQHYH
jgi:hypothetical protein